MIAALMFLAIAATDPQQPDATRATFAATMFFECGQMMAAQPTRVAFTKEVRDLAKLSTADPKFAALGVMLDDDDGHGCRVRFTGPPAVIDPTAVSMSKMYPGQSQVQKKTSTPDGETITAILLDNRP